MEIIILICVILILLETTYLSFLHAGERLIKRSHHPIYVDTSTLIDGRILAIARTGFITDKLIIPRSVMRELQLLADGTDHEKRTRARAGMDVVNELERTEQVTVELLPDALDRTPVDERLIELAHKNNGAIMTNDFNLNKVATSEGIDVLNVNELSLALEAKYNAGDRLTVKIVGKGNTAGQGVAYADDGTMIVVEDASTRISQEAEVEILRVIQTSAGRMMFARPLKKHRRTKSTKK